MRVYINNRNHLTWLSRMVETLLFQGHEIIVFDNASTYEPLLEWYESCPCNVFRCQQNLGNKAIWHSGILQGYDQPYVVSDPDLDISDIPDDWPEKLMEGCRRYDKYKCGFSLEERGVPPENPAWTEDDFCNHPNGLPYIWKKKLDGGFLDYPVDTTFALYIPTHPMSVENNGIVVGGIRTDRPYTAKHLPWHVVVGESKDPNAFAIPMTDEFYYYTKHANSDSVTSERMQAMLKEYENAG